MTTTAGFARPIKNGEEKHYLLLERERDQTMPVTRTMARERPSLLPPNKAKGKSSLSTTSHHPLNNWASEEFDGDEALTTSGRTYEELVNASQRQSHLIGIAAPLYPRDSGMSEETDESEPSPNNGRHSVGMMLGKNVSSWSTGRNSLSNWSTIGGGRQADDDGCDDDTESRIPNSVHMGNIMDTGRKSNVSLPSLGEGRNSLETPIDVIARHVNISQRRSNHPGSRATQRSKIGSARASYPSYMDNGGRPSSLNMSHISSSSSSGVLDASGDDLMLDNSWTPIRTSLEHSFDKSLANEAAFPHNGSLSPIRDRKSSTLPSPKRSPIKLKSPIRSPFGAVSPNRSPKRSPKKANSPKLGTVDTSVTALKKKALSPNGTYSLKEAEGKLLSTTKSMATTNVESCTGSSSNMSLSSGSDATLEQVTSSQKLVLRSLSSSHNGFKKAEDRERGVAKTTQEAGAGMATLSPEKSSIRENIRSPVPTPNSQRKVIKRFRSSVPTANYLVRDDVTQAHSTRNVMAAVADPAKNIHGVKEIATAQGVSNEETINSAYENAFVFPSDSINLPRVKTLRMFHDQAISNGSLSHQYQLNSAGANLISLQEVLLPSIAFETNAVLKRQQAKAEWHAQKEVVETIETCRKVVIKCTGEAIAVVGEAWREREKERQRLQVERFKREEEKQRVDKLNAKKNRKEARAQSRRERYERQKSEKRLNHHRNKEMWQEVAKLMVDIQKLEKEERLWKEALVEVNRLVVHHQPPEKMELDSVLDEKGNNQLLISVEKANLESIAATLVGDVTMATERINWMLKSVSLAMDESEKLRKEAYDKYQYDGHKFWGYPNVDDSKGLFIALSMESPFKGL
jgi:hypothetical protein